ncbi:hypothetical protein H4R18_001393 [Coemansia javaensis]|uniref:Uncharacterized protein n=1 Tax=Coemansia javaensis TaxID=2761396 RepID=A0A9W8LLN2_9FUNG|nr:hypothetical protein H4R18_001393 [Coemansia javaensis]
MLGYARTKARLPAIMGSATDEGAVGALVAIYARHKRWQAKAVDIALGHFEREWLSAKKPRAGSGAVRNSMGAACVEPSSGGLGADVLGRFSTSIAMLWSLHVLAATQPGGLGRLLAEKATASRVLRIVLSARVHFDVRMVAVALVGRWCVLLRAHDEAAGHMRSVVDSFFQDYRFGPDARFLPPFPEAWSSEGGWHYPLRSAAAVMPGYFYLSVLSGAAPSRAQQRRYTWAPAALSAPPHSGPAPSAPPLPPSATAHHTQRAVLMRRQPPEPAEEPAQDAPPPELPGADPAPQGALLLDEPDLAVAEDRMKELLSLSDIIASALYELGEDVDPRVDAGVQEYIGMLGESYGAVLGFDARLSPEGQHAELKRGMGEAASAANSALAIYDERIRSYEARQQGPRSPAIRRPPPTPVFGDPQAGSSKHAGGGQGTEASGSTSTVTASESFSSTPSTAAAGLARNTFSTRSDLSLSSIHASSTLSHSRIFRMIRSTTIVVQIADSDSCGTTSLKVPELPKLHVPG